MGNICPLLVGHTSGPDKIKIGFATSSIDIARVTANSAVKHCNWITAGRPVQIDRGDLVGIVYVLNRAQIAIFAFGTLRQVVPTSDSFVLNEQIETSRSLVGVVSFVHDDSASPDPDTVTRDADTGSGSSTTSDG